MKIVLLFIFIALAWAEYKYWPATSDQIQYYGRYDVDKDGMILFDWSNFGFSVNFTGTSIGFRIHQPQYQPPSVGDNDYDVFIDNKRTQLIQSNSKQQDYLLFFAKDDKVRNLRLVKRTEALFGVVKLESIFTDTTATLIKPIPKPTKKMEFIGDSLTCAFGVEGTPPCPFTALTENILQSYAIKTAQALGADVHVECWSGKGVVRNFNDSQHLSKEPMPIFVPRAVANDPSSLWNFSRYQPDILVINLGSNDFSTQPNPTQEEFTNGYMKLIAFFMDKYPNTKLYLPCGPTCKGPCCSYVQLIAAQAKQQYGRVSYVDLHPTYEPGDLGCLGHPSVKMQQKMADWMIRALTLNE